MNSPSDPLKTQLDCIQRQANKSKANTMFKFTQCDNSKAQKCPVPGKSIHQKHICKNVSCGTLSKHILKMRPVSTSVVKNHWDTRRKSLTQLPVVSYCYQIIVFSTHSLAPSPLSPKINVELNIYEDFFTNCNIEQGGGGGLHFYIGHEICSLS